MPAGTLSRLTAPAWVSSAWPNATPQSAWRPLANGPTAWIQSYKGVHNILKNKLDQRPFEPAPDNPLPVHDNIRGQNYYN